MLFISKKVSYQPLLDFLKEKEIDLIDQPMISFKGSIFECPKNEEADILFFSSPRAVKYYMNQCKVPKSIQVASIGKSTSKTLKKHNITIAFEGVKSGETEKVANDFKTFVQDRKVLFPQSDRSNRSMQKHLPQDQVIDLIVYNTELTPIKLADTPETLVFTSPSNAEAFLASNEIKKNQKVIAWGTTTEQFLLVNKVKVIHTLKYSSFEELTALLKTQLD